MATKDIGPKNPVAQTGDMVVDYVDHRTGAKTGLNWFLNRNIPAETGWFQTLGFTALALFGLQAVTGIILAMYYRPDPATAYESIRVITDDLTWGWLVRGMHKWGASAMVVVVFLHMGRVFFFGAYKYPRELTWVTGALLLVMTLFMGLTGYLLVWDQKAYWATVVAVNITASAPVLGPYIADILRAGPEFGPSTLSRFYSIHMLLIPGGMIAFIGIHLFLVSKLGVAEPPWSKRLQMVEREKEEAKRQAARDRLPTGRTRVPVRAPDHPPLRTPAPTDTSESATTPDGGGS
ncbi:MAG: cytochrome b N-terminal domain-containing protein [Thermoleophilia bacterium]|nr:cytochrome b N-terminal domain-containing protein [Thermoleophilia bacterium]